MKHVTLEQLEFATFKQLVNSRFNVLVAPEKTVELELVEAEFTGGSETDTPARPAYESFSLIFVGPASTPLPQQIHQF